MTEKETSHRKTLLRKAIVRRAEIELMIAKNEARKEEIAEEEINLRTHGSNLVTQLTEIEKDIERLQDMVLKYSEEGN